MEDPSPFGVVVLDEQQRITSFVEKPPREAAPSNLINAGTWLFEPAVVPEMDATTPNRVEYALFPALASAGRAIFGYHPRETYWLDVGTAETYRRANLELLGGALPRCLPNGWPADGLAIEGAEVAPGARLRGPVLLGAGTVVGEGAELLGPLVAGSRCTIHTSARVTGSILWDDVTVKEDAIVADTILASGVLVGRGAVVDDAIVGHGATIEAGARVPAGTRIDPGARWPRGQ